MESNEKPSKWDFRPWPGVPVFIDPNLPPDHFYRNLNGEFHIGAGTDLQLRLFYLNLTKQDLDWLREMSISLGNK